MTRWLLVVLTTALLLAGVAGCDNSANKNVNSGKDRPKQGTEP